MKIDAGDVTSIRSRHGRRRRLGAAAAALVVAAGVAIAVPASANAATIAACGNAAAPHGLNAAITAANAADGPRTILLLPCTYVITTPADPGDPTGPTGLPEITGQLTIIGAGAVITRSASAPDLRIMHVDAGASLTLKYLTVANGFFAGGHLGAGILVLGTLTLQRSALVHNVSG